MIGLTGQVLGSESVQGKFTVVTNATVDRVREAVKNQGLELLRMVKEKLSDDVLHVRSGRLRKSINEKSTDDGRTFTSTTGTNLIYARIHEMGASNLAENVRAYLRRTKASTKEAHSIGWRGRNKISIAREASMGACQVHAFTRQMNMPKASFLVSSLQDRKEAIRSALTRAVQGGVQ